MSNNLNSIYRGIIKNNQDPENKGRCRIFVPGIYPSKCVNENQVDLLPWAEPAMGLFGGSWKNEIQGEDEYPEQLNNETGICSVPHGNFNIPYEGAQVWVFFENGDSLKPVYFAACQSGGGWFAEHEAQHVVQTNNVRIRIDEQPVIEENEAGAGCGKSTCAFPTFNNKCTALSARLHHKKQVPARVDVEIWNKGLIGLNLIIKGDVNMKVEGNMYEHVIGDKHITHEGNLYYKHDGHTQYVQNGMYNQVIKGDTSYRFIGENTNVIDGNKKESINGNLNLNVIKNKIQHIEENYFRRTSQIDRIIAGISAIRKSMYVEDHATIDLFNFSQITIRSLSRKLISTLSDVTQRIKAMVDIRIKGKEEVLIESEEEIKIDALEKIEITSENELTIFAKTKILIDSAEEMIITASETVEAMVGEAWNFIKMYIPFIKTQDEPFPNDFDDKN